MAIAAKKTGNKDLIVRMITPTFRLSHPHLFKANAPNPKDAPKFQATMMLSKKSDLMGCTLAVTGDDGSIITPSKPISLKEILRNAKIIKYGAQENWPDDLQSCVGDGDDSSYHKKGEKEGYKGHYVVKMTSREDQRPGVVDSDGTPITDPGVIYPGCYCRAYVYARVWEHETGGCGVQLILDHIQKVKDGKSFGGKKPVEQVFGPLNSGDEGAEAEEQDFF